MFALRCTRKLLDRIDASARYEDDPPRSNTLLGDWTATLMIVRRQHLMVAISNVTLLPVITRAAPYSTLLARFTEDASEVLAELGIDPVKVDAEANAMREVVVARTSDRRVLGSLNDFIRMLDAYRDGRSLLQVALHLADTPCGPLKMESPRDVTRERFLAPVLRLVKG